MRHRIAKNLCPTAARIAGSVMLLGSLTVSAQVPMETPPRSPAQFDPSDIYFQGYLLIRGAEEAEAKKDYVTAAEKLKKARELLDAIRKNYPGWKTEMVESRSKKTSEAESRVFELAKNQREKEESVVAELEGGQKDHGKTIDPGEDVKPLTPPGILEVNPLQDRRLGEAEAEVKRLQDMMKNNSAMGAAESSRNASRLGDVTRQRDALQSQLNAAEANLQSMRARLAASPVESEVKSLNQRINDLEQERLAMAQALDQSSREKTELRAKNLGLEADLKALQQSYSNLQRDSKVERDVANSVVASQRTQLLEMEKKLNEKVAELGKANDRIRSLENELKESADAFAQLKQEKDTLLQEREQMSALLKLNEDGRIEDLIQQNMGLSKNLREANESLERLGRDNNATKDDLNAAMRDLGMAKAQINRLHAERRDQDVRLEEMQKRLKSEEASLAKGNTGADPGEAEMLRDVIQRMLRVQERRRQARDLLVEAAKELGAKDERLAQAVKLFDGEEIQLSPDEQRLVGGQVDDEIFSDRSLAQDPAIVGRNMEALRQDISVLDRTAEKSYLAGRYLPTRELFEMILEQKPGDISALCKLGVVHIKLSDWAAAADTFRRAVEMDSRNPYAHRMLGFSQMNMGDLKSAEQSLKESVTLAPDEALGHNMLGVVCQRLGKGSEAEAAYKAAIAADPMPGDPYYNLARLYVKLKRPEDARKYYGLALEHGAVPDPQLEETINKQP